MSKNSRIGTREVIGIPVVMVVATLGYAALRGYTSDEGRGQAIGACPSSPAIYAATQEDLARLLPLAKASGVEDDSASFRLPSPFGIVIFSSRN